MTDKKVKHEGRSVSPEYVKASRWWDINEVASNGRADKLFGLNPRFGTGYIDGRGFWHSGRP
jgi:hypothetical protein